VQEQTFSRLTTQAKILAAARELFNEHGVESITVRHIAKKIGISHGNLCYHFPRKEDIIIALYQRVVEGMSAQVGHFEPKELRLSMLLGAMTASFALQYEYKFLMIDFVNIMRRIPEIRENFRVIFEVRKQQFQAFIGALREQGVLLKTIPDAQYDKLLLHTYLIGDFWMSEAEILFVGEESAKAPFYADLAVSLVFPYLTAKGRKEYEQFVQTIAGK
jgi:AcrR family transcriptional regulator